jgi:hypothetical protein
MTLLAAAERVIRPPVRTLASAMDEPGPPAPIGPVHAVESGSTTSLCGRAGMTVLDGWNWPPIGETCEECRQRSR